MLRGVGVRVPRRAPNFQRQSRRKFGEGIVRTFLRRCGDQLGRAHQLQSFCFTALRRALPGTGLKSCNGPFSQPPEFKNSSLNSDKMAVKSIFVLLMFFGFVALPQLAHSLEENWEEVRLDLIARYCNYPDLYFIDPDILEEAMDLEEEKVLRNEKAYSLSELKDSKRISLAARMRLRNHLELSAVLGRQSKVMVLGELFDEICKKGSVGGKDKPKNGSRCSNFFHARTYPSKYIRLSQELHQKFQSLSSQYYKENPRQKIDEETPIMLSGSPNIVDMRGVVAKERQTSPKTKVGLKKILSLSWLFAKEPTQQRKPPSEPKKKPVYLTGFTSDTKWMRTCYSAFGEVPPGTSGEGLPDLAPSIPPDKAGPAQNKEGGTK